MMRGGLGKEGIMEGRKEGRGGRKDERKVETRRTEYSRKERRIKGTKEQRREGRKEQRKEGEGGGGGTEGRKPKEGRNKGEGD
jgi:hypothetical protein